MPEPSGDGSRPPPLKLRRPRIANTRPPKHFAKAGRGDSIARRTLKRCPPFRLPASNGSRRSTFPRKGGRWRSPLLHLAALADGFAAGFDVGGAHGFVCRAR